MPWAPWTSQNTFLGLQHIHPNIFQKITNDGYKILCFSHGWDFLCLISKSFIIRLSPLLKSVVPYCFNLESIFHNPLKTWNNKFYLSSYHSLCFGVHKYSLHSNTQTNNAKTEVLHLPPIIISSWPHPLHISWWYSFGTRYLHVSYENDNVIRRY